MAAAALAAGQAEAAAQAGDGKFCIKTLISVTIAIDIKVKGDSNGQVGLYGMWVHI